jgi:hypothetical protein
MSFMVSSLRWPSGANVAVALNVRTPGHQNSLFKRQGFGFIVDEAAGEKEPQFFRLSGVAVEGIAVDLVAQLYGTSQVKFNSCSGSRRR